MPQMLKFLPKNSHFSIIFSILVRRKANDDIFIVKSKKEMDELLKKACSDERLSDGAFRMLCSMVEKTERKPKSERTEFYYKKELKECGYLPSANGCSEVSKIELPSANYCSANDCSDTDKNCSEIEESEPSPMEILARRYRDKMEEQKKW